MDAGIYIAVFRVDAPFVATVGRLGPQRFTAGIWLYVGSAQRNLTARLARHARRRKPLRWHVDSLSTRATMLGAVLIEGGRDRECRVAAELAELYARPIADFGSSDCDCGGHLFLAGDFADPHDLPGTSACPVFGGPPRPGVTGSPGRIPARPSGWLRGPLHSRRRGRRQIRSAR